MAKFQDPDALSGREKEVLHEITAGKTDRQIGTALGISPHTVGSHERNIFQKYRVDNRVSAVVAGLRKGDVQLPDDEELAGDEE